MDSKSFFPFLKPIEHLILDDSISEVMVNGPDRIFIEKAGYLEQVQGRHAEPEVAVGRRQEYRPGAFGDDVSESKPILDSRLPDGSRVAAVIPPCSLSWRHTHHSQVSTLDTLNWRT